MAPFFKNKPYMRALKLMVENPKSCAGGSSLKANGREAKTCLGQVFNYELGCLDDVHVLIYMDARPHLQLKTWPRFSRVS